MCGRLQVGKDFLHVCSIGRDSLFPNGARESPEVDGVIAGALQLIANRFEVGHVGKSALRDPRSLA
jgi:hypothetical protein